MGTEYYLVCETCKEYIDLHKAYEFSMVTQAYRPTVGVNCKENGFHDVTLRGTYWESRGLWFLWKHRGHQVELDSDQSDNWFDKMPYVKEVYPHNDDLKLRKHK